MRSATFGAAILIAASFAGIQRANAGSVSVASFSAGGEKLNRHRANGKVFKPGALTAAHQSLPLGSKVIVTNVHSGRSVIVRVNDRGPAAWTGRAIDLSRGAFQRIASLSSGLISVTIKKAS
jgi:rare lipoprotein A